ncbi:hypothetical protein POPTR_004G001000v4 [Populus trichocarpa]|jgi:hypothetical protein|uniref:Leucine-rich repeat-containing N-terminal plant-type domain-containing protein n=1 Tax=Populus trichocarpa TaxID=3694 RepID=B9N8I7_POPTR|nr:receptor protein-tyrosine kinase CEPR1 [Populus trichocarpa]KAI5590339.1 hypothetical protein BDE02_04G000600 [Populus trichocarpa]PNT38874.1 hypothetical protein POPTR_004G001000v4 [Populus trichocarpa]|eukprot:XP_006383823.1 receptor protein-tyrosine kinase CEPR1 [Populus trichocarpa]
MAKPQSHALFLFLLLLLGNACHPSHQNQNKISLNDLAALAAIKDSLTDIPGSNFFSTWDFTSPDPCSTFSGITCSLNRVTILTLGTGLSNTPRLAGFLSPSLSNLTELTQLILYPGIVTGPIPPQLGRLSNLRVLSLTNNRLKGPIPSSLSSLPNLHTLDLSYNQLTGSIPAGLFTELAQLKVMILASNQLSGELPRMVSAEILHLDLKDNKLTGTLPLRLPSTIRYLSASKNMMGGPLNGLQSLSELEFLDLSMNQFSGPIPSSLLRPTLSSLFLQRNNLSGGVPSPSPPPSSMYGEGSIVDLSHNFLTGELSPVLAAVETLFLNNNHLMGRVPEEYVKSVYGGSTKTLYLQHNYITGFPLEAGLALPDTLSLCLTYNCMVPSVGLMGCPASAGGQLSRPRSQCVVFNHGRPIP